MVYSCLSGSKAAEYQFIYSFLSYLCGSRDHSSVILALQSLQPCAPEYRIHTKSIQSVCTVTLYSIERFSEGVYLPICNGP